MFLSFLIEILLGDGRRFVSERNANLHRHHLNTHNSPIRIIHPDFRVIALANRPGYPFLGNDFYSALGDIFAVHSIDNPDQQSEIQLLRSYAPNVSDDLLKRLTAAFGELRNLSDDGILSYPYSTRELVNVSKHLQMYPQDPLGLVLANVFDFDSFDEDLRRNLFEIFQKHGIPVGGGGSLSQEISRNWLSSIMRFAAPPYYFGSLESALPRWTNGTIPKLLVDFSNPIVSERTKVADHEKPMKSIPNRLQWTQSEFSINSDRKFKFTEEEFHFQFGPGQLVNGLMLHSKNFLSRANKFENENESKNHSSQSANSSVVALLTINPFELVLLDFDFSSSKIKQAVIPILPLILNYCAQDISRPSPCMTVLQKSTILVYSAHFASLIIFKGLIGEHVGNNKTTIFENEKQSIQPFSIETFSLFSDEERNPRNSSPNGFVEIGNFSKQPQFVETKDTLFDQLGLAILFVQKTGNIWFIFQESGGDWKQFKISFNFQIQNINVMGSSNSLILLIHDVFGNEFSCEFPNEQHFFQKNNNNLSNSIKLNAIYRNFPSTVTATQENAGTLSCLLSRPFSRSEVAPWLVEKLSPFDQFQVQLSETNLHVLEMCCGVGDDSEGKGNNNNNKLESNLSYGRMYGFLRDPFQKKEQVELSGQRERNNKQNTTTQPLMLWLENARELLIAHSTTLNVRLELVSLKEGFYRQIAVVDKQQIRQQRNSSDAAFVNNNRMKKTRYQKKRKGLLC